MRRRSEALDLDAIPAGERCDLHVEMAEDALGQPVCLPVMVARGSRPGPVLGLTAAVHGNELNGLPLIHRLFEHVDPVTLAGTIVGVPVLNVPGYLLRQRQFNDGGDLNQLFPGAAAGPGAQVWAHRFTERVLSRFDTLIDLHTASGGRVNSLYVRANLLDPVTAELARLLRPEIVLHSPAPDSTLRGQAQARGIPAVTLEIGNPQRVHGPFLRASLAGLLGVLAHLGMQPRRSAESAEEPIVCKRSSWMYTDRGGFLEVLPDVGADVADGELVARLHDVFGNLTREYRAPAAGVVIGKSVDPVAHTGARILHLGIVGSP